jgi:NAD(P)-dependent dehydrogenase (short-subunit alcohol dehydrogenase family)
MTQFDQSDVPRYGDLLRLDGRTFIVVGAGVGIGRQASHALAQAGARVLCVDIDSDRAREIAEEIGGVGISADARERHDVERVVETAKSSFGGVDGIVDIVGMARFAPLLETPAEDWDWTFGMVLRHAYNLVEIGGRAMAGRGGSMAFVASIDGTLSAPFHAPYGVAKAGLLNLVRTASVELGPLGIRINAVCPGPTNTPRVLAANGKIPVSKADGGSLYIPIGEANDPWDIAAALLFLSSPLSRHITGQAITVDGGTCNTVYDLESVPARGNAMAGRSGG